MDRYESANKAGILGILGNLFLALIKGFAGFTFNSQAMIADSFNSAGDILSSLFTFIGNKISSKPGDNDHNFGHGKSEYIFSFLISISMIIVSAKLLFDSISSLVNHKTLDFSILLVIVCVITIIVKFALFLYTKYLLKKQPNILIEANNKDHFNDCIITSCTLISILFSLIGIFWIDSIVGIIISFYIFYTGIKIFFESYNVLMDISIDEDTKKIILDITNKYEDIKEVESIYSTPSGYKYIVIITISVDGNMTTFNSHALADNLENDIKSLDKVSNAIVHVNPV
jgi:cation diffusion facilitator family transporter